MYDEEKEPPASSSVWPTPPPGALVRLARAENPTRFYYTWRDTERPRGDDIVGVRLVDGSRDTNLLVMSTGRYSADTMMLTGASTDGPTTIGNIVAFWKEPDNLPEAVLPQWRDFHRGRYHLVQEVRADPNDPLGGLFGKVSQQIGLVPLGPDRQPLHHFDGTPVIVLIARQQGQQLLYRLSNEEVVAVFPAPVARAARLWQPRTPVPSNVLLLARSNPPVTVVPVALDQLFGRSKYHAGDRVWLHEELLRVMPVQMAMLFTRNAPVLTSTITAADTYKVTTFPDPVCSLYVHSRWLREPKRGDYAVPPPAKQGSKEPPPLGSAKRRVRVLAKQGEGGSMKSIAEQQDPEP